VFLLDVRIERLIKMSLQVILGLDVSASMQTVEGRAARIDIAKELAGPVIQKACQLDASGPDVYTFGQKVTYLGNITAAQAKDKLNSLAADQYATNLGAFLGKAFQKAREFISQGDNALILVFTDGAASDKGLVKSEIINMTGSMTEDSQCALEIVYFGDEAATYLKELDDDLQSQGGKFDIVDATPISEAITLAVEELLNKAFND
jgi:Mg-chelatase subunit ChlD